MTKVESIRRWAEHYADVYAAGDVDRLHAAMRAAAYRTQCRKHPNPRIVLRARHIGHDWTCTEAQALEYLETYHPRQPKG